VHYGGPLRSALKFFDLRVRRLLVRRKVAALVAALAIASSSLEA
jgi:hypothetical protein